MQKGENVKKIFHEENSHHHRSPVRSYSHRLRLVRHVLLYYFESEHRMLGE